jgi:rRNA maturation RNase YbeY
VPDNQTINIFNEDATDFDLDKGMTLNWLSACLSDLGFIKYEINYIFCSDEYLLKINQDHLNHDFYTDIITFDNSEEESNFLESDIFISIDRVRENADANEASFYNELCRVMIHGVLHLSGQKDKTEFEQQVMRGREDKYLALHPLFN